MAGRNAIIRVSVLSDTKGFHKGISDIESKFGKFGSRMDDIGQKAGKVLAGGLAIAGAAAVKAGQKASDLAETTSKVGQIFGKDAVAGLEKFSKSAATSLGMSRQTALDSAATFGVFGKAAGKSGEDLVSFSTDMTRLAADMASFNNTSPEEAITAIGAALRGESEPIRQYGVLLDDATLRQRAMALGITKTTTEALTPQQKVLAAQAEILAQTKDQQGDFARTSEGLANKQRILKAQFENLQVSIGEKVLPALVKLSAWGLKTLEWVDKNRKLVGILVVTFGSLLAILYTISVAMRAWIVVSKAVKVAIIVWRNAQLALNLAMMMNPIGLVIAAIVALVAIFVIAWKKSETFRNIVKSAWNGIKTASIAVFNFLKGFIKRIWDGIKAYFTFVFNLYKTIFTRGWNALVNIVRSIGGKVVDAARNMKDRLLSFLSNAGSWLYNIGKDLIRGLINGVGNMAGALVDKVGGVVGGAIDKAKNLLGIGSPSKLFRQYGEWTAEGLAIGLKKKAGLAASAATGLARKVSEGFEAPDLTIPSRPSLTAAQGGSGAGSTTVQINVSVPVGGNPADTGREVVKAIDAYYKQGGRRL